jgi:hypothetical protein
MLASSIGWILIISGVGAAAGGLAAFFLPRTTLQLVCGAKSSDGVTIFFVRHWGALLFVVCALTVYSAYVPASRVPILTASIIEKFAIFALVFFGPLKRTIAMTVGGIMDGVLAILFTAYLAGF